MTVALFQLSDSPGKRALKIASTFMVIMLIPGAVTYSVMHDEIAMVPMGVAMLVLAVLVWTLIVTRPFALSIDANDVRAFRGARELARASREALVVEAHIFNDSETGEVPVVVLRFPNGKRVSIGSWSTIPGWSTRDEVGFPPRYQLERDPFHSLVELLGIVS